MPSSISLCSWPAAQPAYPAKIRRSRTPRRRSRSGCPGAAGRPCRRAAASPAAPPRRGHARQADGAVRRDRVRRGRAAAAPTRYGTQSGSTASRRRLRDLVQNHAECTVLVGIQNQHHRLVEDSVDEQDARHEQIAGDWIRLLVGSILGSLTMLRNLPPRRESVAEGSARTPGPRPRCPPSPL